MSLKLVKFHNKDNSSYNLSQHESLHTRGNKYKIYKKQVNYDLRKYFFSDRIIAIWNTLPYHVVASVSLNMFKNWLDSFLHAQEVYFNWETDLTGTVTEVIVLSLNRPMINFL
jgi:hypothetical protein